MLISVKWKYHYNFLLARDPLNSPVEAIKGERGRKRRGKEKERKKERAREREGEMERERDSESALQTEPTIFLYFLCT